MAQGALYARRRAHQAGERGKELPSELLAASKDDPHIVDAYDAGRAGVSWGDFQGRQRDEEPETEPVSAPSASDGAGASRPTRTERRSPRRRRRAAGAPRAVRRFPGVSTAVKLTGGGFSGLLLGAVAYALVLSVVDYGPSGPGLWFKAKFLNEVAGAPAPSAPSSAAKAPPSPTGGSSPIPGSRVPIGPFKPPGAVKAP